MMTEYFYQFGFGKEVSVIMGLFLATNAWDQMFTDASTAITALGTSATTLIGLVFSAIILLFVGFKLVKKAANKV